MIPKGKKKKKELKNCVLDAEARYLITHTFDRLAGMAIKRLLSAHQGCTSEAVQPNQFLQFALVPDIYLSNNRDMPTLAHRFVACCRPEP
jgi:hypothetical protein